MWNRTQKLRRYGCLVACVSLLLSVGVAAGQNSKIDDVLHQLEQVHTFSGVSISPDGKWIAWSPGQDGSARYGIYLLDWKNPTAKPEGLSAAEGKGSFRQTPPVWSPDSTQVAFFSDVGGEGQQVYVLPLRSRKARRLTRVKGYMTDLRWSPQGDRLSFLYAENGGGGGPLEAVPAQTGAIGSDIHNQRVTIVNLSDGALRQVSPPELNVYEYDWCPDGKRVAALAAPGPGDNNWWTAKLYVLGIDSGRMEALYRPPPNRQLAIPRWSPDGKQIAFIGGLMSDEGFNGGDIFVLPSEGGEARDVTLGRRASPSWLTWHGNRELIFTEADDGGSAISTLNLGSGDTETLWKGGEGVHDGGNYPNFSMASDGRTSAVIRSSWERPPEVWGGPVGSWRQLTQTNAAQHAQWGKAESVIWKDDDYRVQGWLLYPQNFDPSKRYPMVVEIHGGPAGIRTASWPSSHFDMSVMAGLGYFVFFPNPRGSYGEGEAFTKANVKDFGHGDLRDILTGVDIVLNKVPVDRARIGVTGWSYGGYMTAWTLTQTNRFKAVVVGAGLTDMYSMYATNWAGSVARVFRRSCSKAKMVRTRRS